ncbi:MAG: PAS domain-containing sensor histidine kinase [Chloroflexota bacterium]|nr:PAS domain-containing sensor histidine kinase [Chloroflexota bacterium]
METNSSADETTVAIQHARLIEQLAKRERQLAAIVEHNPTGILLLDQEGQVLLQNPIAEAMTGTTMVKGAASIGQLLPLQDETGQPLALPLPDDSAPATVRGYLQGPDGGRGRYVQVSLTSLMQGIPDRAPRVEGYVVNLVDLTALKEAESAKSIFLAGLSHEFKTPLSLIRGYAETLRYPQVRKDADMYEEALDVILEETEHLTEMVNQLLLAARLQAGALSLELHEVAVGRLIHKLVEGYRETHPGYRWQLSLSEDLPSIQADPNRIRAVFHNLLSNAAKYSEPGSLIHVRAEPTDTGVRISIHDEGIGISQEDQSRLFQRFFRASDRADGTGLGLYMSKAIVEAHGGRITVESELGEGSTFTVELPRRARANESGQD